MGSRSFVCLRVALLRGGCNGLFEKLFKDQQNRSTRDGAVGQVECGKVVLCPVKIQEIDHITIQQAIDHIAQGS